MPKMLNLSHAWGAAHSQNLLSSQDEDLNIITITISIARNTTSKKCVNATLPTFLRSSPKQAHNEVIQQLQPLLWDASSLG